MPFEGWGAFVVAGVKPWTKLTIGAPVTVDTSATPLPIASVGNLENRKGIWLFNLGTSNCFIGVVDVDNSNEAILFAGQSIVIPVADNVTIFGRVASGSATILPWEFV